MSHIAKHEVGGRMNRIRSEWKAILEHRLNDPFTPKGIGYREMMSDALTELRLLHESSDSDQERNELAEIEKEIHEYCGKLHADRDESQQG